MTTAPATIVAAILVSVSSPIAHAQPDSRAGMPAAADPGAPVGPVTYESPFARFRPFAPGTAVGTWKGVNDEVGRIGGWKVYAREVFEASQPPSSSAEESAKPSAERNGQPGRVSK